MTRIVLLGNNRAACLVLDAACEVLGEESILALPPPPSEVADWHESLQEVATNRQIRVVVPDDINAPDAVATIRQFDPDLMLSVYYTQIFGKALLSSVECPVVNVHPSLLPRHRGTAPLIWSIVEGETKTGVTIHHVDSGVDTGRVISQRLLPIHWSDTGFTLHQKAAQLVRAMCIDLLRTVIVSGVPAGEEQAGEETTHRHSDPRVNKIQWADASERIRNIIRALSAPLPGAFAVFGGVRVGIHLAEAVHDLAGHTPGYVSVDPHGWVEVETGAGRIRLLTVEIEGSLYHGPALGGVRVGGRPLFHEGDLAK